MKVFGYTLFGQSANSYFMKQYLDIMSVVDNIVIVIVCYFNIFRILSEFYSECFFLHNV